jgi:hypothetical protein
LLLLPIINTRTAITKSIKTYESPRRVRISGTLKRFLVFFMADKADVVDVESSQQKEDYTEQPISGVWTYAAVAEFSCCFFGLQISYLIWGIMQELIMDTKFNPTPLNPSGMFPSATFCVFSNRFLAIIVAAVICRVKYGISLLVLLAILFLLGGSTKPSLSSASLSKHFSKQPRLFP